MSLKKHNRDSSVAQGVALYSRDAVLVKSIEAALLQSVGKREYIVIHQDSLTSIDNVCTVSVLDINMVGSTVSGVIDGITKIKHKEPEHPLFLVGDKAVLSEVMQDIDVKRSVTRTVAKPMVGPKILTALNLAAAESKSGSKRPAKSQKAGSYGRPIMVVFAIALLGVAAWYINDKPESDVSSDGSSKTLSAEALPTGNELENSKLAGAESATEMLSDDVEIADKIDMDLTVMDEKLTSIPQANSDVLAGLDTATERNEKADTTDLMPKAVDAVTSDIAIDTETTLFNSQAQVFLDQASAALKQGYIVGPEDQSALHFYRQALEVDPYSDLAKTRKDTVIEELTSEFALASELSKYGRSKSILSVIMELDPFNSELESMSATFNNRFRSK